MSEVDHDMDESPPLLRERGFVVSGETLWQWWQAAHQQAMSVGIAPTEADWLLQTLVGLTALDLRLASFRSRPQILLPWPFSHLQELWQQRIRDRVPVQYLAGKAPWREFALRVSPAVLIPRPETEMLIDLAVRADQEHGERGKAKGEREKQPSIPHSPFPIPHSPPKSKIQNPKSKIQNLQGFHWADLGTGSGAIAMGLATAFPEARIHAIDQSGAALAIAQANAADYGLSDRIHFYQGSWLEPLTALKGQIWGIASNPPYIPSQMVLELQPEITQHEPHTALDGGPDGLDCIRHLIATAPTYLQPGGIFLLEMMAGQAPLVVDLLHQQGNYKHIQIHKDLAGIERFVLAHRKLCTLEL